WRRGLRQSECGKCDAREHEPHGARWRAITNRPPPSVTRGTETFHVPSIESPRIFPRSTMRVSWFSGSSHISTESDCPASIVAAGSSRLRGKPKPLKSTSYPPLLAAFGCVLPCALGG